MWKKEQLLYGRLRGIDDDDCAKIFETRSRLSKKKIPEEVAGSCLGVLSIRMTRSDKDRVHSLSSHSHEPR